MRGIYIFLIFIFCACFAASSSAKAHTALHKTVAAANNISHKQIIFYSGADTVTHQKRKHKLWAALLALPLPFGIFGLHRAYLGTSAAVPFLYIASAGGGLGILPFVDFMLIILCKDVNVYAYSSRIFMWSRKMK